jgi:hypothetical protein
MATAETPKTPPPATLSANALRIVLFGMPGAGKSSLLGALSQAAQAQEHLLNAHLNDLSHGLAELRQRLYDENGRPTAEEVVPYPVDFEPLGDGAQSHVAAAIIDCDGRVANDLLVRHKALDENSPEGTLAHEVLEADALVLVIDAAAPPNQLDADFKEFEGFLRQMELQRGRQIEVSGLPVFLVLSKCDLLARPEDTVGDWMEKIEQRKREVDAQFREFLARRSAEAASLPFGQIDLRLWATAVKRPALAGAPPRPREPYGVAELFRQCLDRAVAFRARNRRADSRLYWITGAAATVIVALCSLLVALALRPPEAGPSELQRRVQELEYRDRRTPAERLRGSVAELKIHRDDLQTISQGPGFDGLPRQEQEFVTSRLNELNEYIPFFERILKFPRPSEADSFKALQQIEDGLKDSALEPPHEDWKTTEAATIRREELEDIAALRDAIDQVQDWYVNSYEKAHALWLHAGEPPSGSGEFNWPVWQQQADDLLRPNRVLPYDEHARLPGSDRLTYAVVMRFGEVVAARARWDSMKPRLSRVRNLAAALGLIPASTEHPGSLVIELPPKFLIKDAGPLLQTLQGAYPNYRSEFVRAGLPDAFAKVVESRARIAYDNLLAPTRALILQRLKDAGTGASESVSRWNGVRDWLKSEPEDLAAWRTLAVILVRLYNPEAADPVSELAAFLGQTAFTIEIKRLTLRVPEDLNVKVPPTSLLSIYHPEPNKTEPALVFEQEDQAVRDTDRHQWIYTYRPRGGKSSVPIIYKPGDDFWAVLPLRDGLQFTWARSHSAMYQFQALNAAPRLHKATEANTEGKIAEGVVLEVSPKDGVPRVPDLMPVVPAKLTP